MRVLLTHNPEDLRAYYGRALPELEAVAEVVRNPAERDLTTDELIAAAAGCDVVIAHRATPGEAALFERSPDLLAFLRCAVDISTIDIEAASANGVVVARADKSFVASTAELALGLLIDTARNISASTIDYQAGRPPPQRPGRQLRDRAAGIIGYGAIGSYLADLLVSIGMRVLVHDPHVDSVSDDVEQVDLVQLLSRADVVFPLAPGGAATENLIGASELAAMKRGAILVNVSRGELLDEVAVAAALESGQLGGLAMDVGRAPDQRPSPALAGHPGVVATPHLGGLTPENADAQAASSVEQVKAMIDRSMPPRSVNPDHATRLRAYWTR
ncbi:MAG: hydroxyacid dehydrogenase [Acidimicrobiia bacterium]|nr:hydroxyacid dehydrogenase [Acidimicrobiia bacterium]